MAGDILTLTGVAEETAHGATRADTRIVCFGSCQVLDGALAIIAMACFSISHFLV